MDFRTTVVKTLMNEEIDSTELISEETLSLIENDYFDEFSDNTIDELFESEMIDFLEEALSKKMYVHALKRSTEDPDYEDERQSRPDTDKVIARAKKHHGDKFAKDLGNMAKHIKQGGRRYGSAQVKASAPASDGTFKHGTSLSRHPANNQTVGVSDKSKYAIIKGKRNPKLTAHGAEWRKFIIKNALGKHTKPNLPK